MVLNVLKNFIGAQQAHMPNVKPAPPNALLLGDMFKGCFQRLKILDTLYYGDSQSRIPTIQHISQKKLLGLQIK